MSVSGVTMVATRSRGLATDALGFGGEAAALLVGQPQAATSELLLEGAVLIDEVGDDLGLVAADDAGEKEKGEQGRGGGERACTPASGTADRTVRFGP